MICPHFSKIYFNEKFPKAAHLNTFLSFNEFLVACWLILQGKLTLGKKCNVFFYAFIYDHILELCKLEYVDMANLWCIFDKFFKALVKRYILKLQDDKLVDYEKFVLYKLVTSNLSCRKFLKVGTRKGQSATVQLRVSRCFLNSTLCKYSKNLVHLLRNACNCVKFVSHFVITCKLFGEHRSKMFEKIVFKTGIIEEELYFQTLLNNSNFNIKHKNILKECLQD